MSKTTRCAPYLLAALAMLAAFAPGAWAFYPFGFFNDTQGGQLVIIKWPLSAFDTNGDGDVSGPNEGIVLNFEVGNGADGFDTTEVDKILAGFTEWELVSTCYVAFQRGQNITDPVELTPGLDLIDTNNMVVFQSEDDVTADGDLTGGSVFASLVANTFEDTFVTIGGITVPVSGGRILDVDTVFSSRIRETLPNGLTGLLEGASTFAAGVFLGIGWSPLENSDPDASDLAGVLVENRVVAIRNFDGTIGLRGVTSSQLNEFIGFDSGGGTIVDSHRDLAPDDIAAVTFMYPRSDQDLFFNINQRARTNGSANVPSVPIGGAWIRAWCDSDNSAATARVPMFDTLTGLYQNGIDVSFRGHFQLKGLFKQLETINQQSFTASYTITSSEFLPVVFGGDDRGLYDSTHGGFNQGSPGEGAIVYDSLFPAEVFNENGNLFGLSNVNQGTPLVFNLITRKIQSQTSGKTLDTILATGRSMFGTSNEVCPLNVVIGPVDQGAVVALRGMRDKFLLTNAIGTAIADAYYRVAPFAARFFADHENATVAARWLFAAVRWVFANAEWLLAAVAAALTGLMFRHRALRARAAGAASLSVLALLLWGPSAHAQMLPYELSDYLAQSDDVIVGKVGEVESRWINNNTKIVTDVSIQVEQSIKGTQNKGGTVHIQTPTGRVGAVGRSSPQIPEFKRGEEVLVFLNAQKRGYMVTGGVAGKYLVAPHPKTGEKYVFATSLPGHTRLVREAAKMEQRKMADGIQLSDAKGPMKPNYDKRVVVKLDEFVRYLHELTKEQAKLTVTSAKPLN